MSRSLPTPARRAARRGEEGQGMVEYAFILVLIAAVAVVALVWLGHATNTLFSNVSAGIGT